MQVNTTMPTNAANSGTRMGEIASAISPSRDMAALALNIGSGTFAVWRWLLIGIGLLAMQ